MVWVQYPRKFDLKDEIAFLKKLGDAFGNDPQHDSWPVSSEYIHVEAFRIAWWYFALVRSGSFSGFLPLFRLSQLLGMKLNLCQCS